MGLAENEGNIIRNDSKEIKSNKYRVFQIVQTVPNS